MKAAQYYGPGDIRIEEMPAPEAGPGEIVVKVRGCGLCGTDLAKYRHRLVETPAVLGHEIAGEVVQLGAGVERYKPGDRVIAPHHIPCFVCDYCRHGNFSMCALWKKNQFWPGGFAEFVRIGAASVQYGVCRLPADLDDDAATLVEPLACCVRAHERHAIMAGDSVVIIGAGTAGLLHVQVALLRGAARVIAVDLQSHRLELARKLGAHVVVNPRDEDPVEAVRKATGKQGADTVVTAVGLPGVIEQAIAMTRDGGTVNVFAECPPGSKIAVDPNLMYRREVTLLGTYSSSPMDFRAALRLVASGRVRARELISHRMPLGRLEEAVQIALKGTESLKIVIRPNE